MAHLLKVPTKRELFLLPIFILLLSLAIPGKVLLLPKRLVLPLELLAKETLLVVLESRGEGVPRRMVFQVPPRSWLPTYRTS